MRLRDSSEEWRRVEELFLAAADLPVEHQAAFLELQCAGDEELRREVESLLRYDQSEGPSLPEVLQSAASLLLDEGMPPGNRLGAYRIQREIGSGGMATVYLAERDDDQYRKRVAIKVVKKGAPSGPWVEGFRHERQILANLDHPYIARLLDGGSTEDGVPYLVMEYVEGLPIDAYCDQHGLSIDCRCELFRKVCEAVSYAHRKLVIHRDLKPGNILVSAEGTPKLLDFGIAKLLTPDGSRTQYGAGFGLTPDYASPEQVRGEPVTTATDVYSLGALLYRMLSGAKPHPITTYTPGEVQRIVCSAEPLRPSTAATHEGWRKRLKGDLDNIVLMAMRKEPERRYGSVEQLSEDVRRHLVGLPVAAREDTLAYGAGKFLRRHWVGATAAALTAAGLTAGAGAALWQAQQAREASRVAERARQVAEAQTGQAQREHARANLERDEAVKARSLAEQRLEQLVELANRSVFDIQGAIVRLPGATEARRRIAKTTLDFLDGLARDAGGDERVLRVLAQAYTRLGDVLGMPDQASLGNTQGALESYRKAYAILQRLVQEQPGDDELQARLADLHYRTGLALVTNSQTKEGIAAYERGLVLARRLEGRRPRDPGTVKQVGALEQVLARSYQQIDLTRAVDYAARQRATFQRLLVLRPKDDAVIEELSSAYVASASVMALAGDLGQAVEDTRKCVEIREELAARHPNDAELQRNLMLAYGHIGDRLGYPHIPNLGNPRAAKPYYQRAKQVVEAMVAADASNRMARLDLATVLSRLGAVSVGPEEREEALASLRQAAGIFEEYLAANPRHTSARGKLAEVYEYTGTRLMEAGAYGEALAAYRKSQAISERQIAEDPGYASPRYQLMTVYKGIALVRAKQGDRSGALEQMRTIIDTAAKRAKEETNQRPMQRYPALIQEWLGTVYETLAVNEKTQSGNALADWRQARDAYRRSQAEWATVEPAYRAWSQPDIQEVTERLRYCEQRVQELETRAR